MVWILSNLRNFFNMKIAVRLNIKVFEYYKISFVKMWLYETLLDMQQIENYTGNQMIINYKPSKKR